jgi:phosphonatase-like hydrolase
VSRTQIELVVFDLVGTTIYDDGACHRLLCAALIAAGLPADHTAIQRVAGLPTRERIQTLLTGMEFAQDAALLADSIHEQYYGELLFRYQTDDSIQEIPGAGALFRRLHDAGIMVALNTSLNRQLAEVLLSRMGWERDGLIDATITSDEVQHGRPFPDMIFGLMERLNVYGARHVAKIGDTPSDIQEGRNAGCGLVVGVTNGAQKRNDPAHAELRQAGANALLDSVAGLAGLLQLAESVELADE